MKVGLADMFYTLIQIELKFYLQTSGWLLPNAGTKIRYMTLF